MAIPLVISVVLNTNHCADTLVCIKSLEQNTYRNHHIILLDNSSTDGTIKAVQTSHPAVQIINLKENLGYAGNNNIGIEEAIKLGADWIFVVNEDTVFSPDCIELLISEGESDPKIGVVGPMVFHFNEPEVIQSAGGKMNQYYQGWHLGQNELDCGQYKHPLRVDWISGCGIMVRRPVIDQVGAIDARFFYYLEEFEWCIRAKDAGWQIVVVPAAKMWHKGVQRDYSPSPYVTYYSTRNLLFILYKHKASLIAWIVIWSAILRSLISWSIKPKWRSKLEHRNAMWRGIIDFSRRRWGKMSE